MRVRVWSRVALVSLMRMRADCSHGLDAINPLIQIEFDARIATVRYSSTAMPQLISPAKNSFLYWFLSHRDSTGRHVMETMLFDTSIHRLV